MNPVVIPENIVCCICSASVKFADLEFHLAVLHFNSDPYQCDQCDYDYDNLPSRFPTEAAIKEHMREKHKTRDFSYRVWSNPEIDRARENISNCMAQSVQNTMRIPETRVVSGMKVNSVNILAPPPVPVILNDNSRRQVQLPTTYEKPQSHNAVVQSPISAQLTESVRQKLITVTRTPTYQFDTTYEMPQSNIVVVRTPISPPERPKLLTVTGAPMNEVPQLIPSKASANRPSNSKIEVIKIESDDELDEKTDLRRSEFDNAFPKIIPIAQPDPTYKMPQSCNAVVQTPISAPPPEIVRPKLVSITRAGNTRTYQLVAAGQISKINQAIIQTPISAPPSESAKRKLVSAPMNERPLLTPSKASTSRAHNNSSEVDLGSYGPNSDVIVLDSDEEGDELGHEDSEITELLPANIDHLVNNDLTSTQRKQEIRKAEGWMRQEMERLNANAQALPDRTIVRRDEKYLVQCEACNAWVKNKKWNKKAHINRMHLQLATHICKICRKSYYYNSSYEAEKHVRLKHGKWEKDIMAFIHEQKHHWDVVADHIHEFFPNNLLVESQSKSDQRKSDLKNTIKDDTIPCHVCGERIKKKLQVAKAHINGMHLQFPLYTCCKCNREYKSYSMALKHVYEKHPGQPKIEMVKDHPDKQKHWDMLNDHITEFFPTFFASPVQIERYLDLENSEDNLYSAENSNDGMRSNTECSTMPENGEVERPSGATKEQDRNCVRPLVSNKGAKVLVENARPKELIQCRECRLWMVKKLGVAKTHINGMHLHFPLYKCSECDSEYDIYAHAIKHIKEGNVQWRETFIGEEHSIKDHPDKQKHWDMLNNRIKEFFPTFFASAAKLKRNLNFEKRVLGAVKTELDTDLSCDPDLNPATNPAPGTSSSHKPSTSSGSRCIPEIKAEPNEVNELAETPHTSIDEAIERVVQPAPEKAVSVAKVNQRFFNEQLKERCAELFGLTQESEPWASSNHEPSTNSNLTLEVKTEPEVIIEQAKDFFERTPNSEPGTSSSHGSIQAAAEKVVLPATKKYLFCRGCQRNVYGVPTTRMMYNHVNITHARYPLYECAACQKQFQGYDIRTVNKHIDEFHNGDLSLIRDYRSVYDEQLKDECIELFGTAPDSLPSASSSREQVAATNTSSVPNFTPEIKTEPEVITEQADKFFGRTMDSESGTSSNHGSIRPIKIAPKKVVLPTTKNYLFCPECQRNVYGIPSARMMYNHVNINHTRYALYICTACQKTFHDYDITTILKHVNEMHHGHRKFIRDNRNAYGKQLMKKSRELFGLPQDSMPGTSFSHGQTIDNDRKRDSLKYYLLTKTRYMPCGGCQELIGIYAKPMLYSHINVRHARFPVWECVACGAAYYEYVGSAISRHVNDQHNGDRSLIQDNRSKYAQQLKRKCIELFGMIP